MIAGPPEEQADHGTVPAAVLAGADGHTIRPVWVNVLGGVTFEVGARGERDRRFVKWAPAGSRLDLAGEAARMSWAGAYTAVPTVLRSGTDLGALGVADRWADIAIATWSTQWNYGPGWERALLDAYGIEPDPVRTAWYRLLWDMT